MLDAPKVEAGKVRKAVAVVAGTHRAVSTALRESLNRFVKRLQTLAPVVDGLSQKVTNYAISLTSLIHVALTILVYGRRAVTPAAAVPIEPLSFPRPPVTSLSWVRHQELSQTSAYATMSLADVQLGILSIAEQSPKEIELSWATHAWVTHAATLQALCRMLRSDLAGLLHLHVDGKAQSVAEWIADEPLPAAAHIISFEPTAVAAAITDIWFVSDFDVRIRFDRELGSDGVAPFVFRAFQFDGADQPSLSLIGEAPIGHDAVYFADLALANPYFPILLTATTLDGRLLALSLLPFPSLCRGGVHNGELYVDRREDSYLKALAAVSSARLGDLVSATAPHSSFSIGRLDIDLREATGAERIFSRDLHDWLTAVMGVELAAVNASPDLHPKVFKHLSESLAPASISDRSRVRQDAACSLTLPADAIPSLSGLVARNIAPPTGSPAVAGSFVVADPLGTPEWIVFMPPFDGDLLDMQPTSAGHRYPILRALQPIAPTHEATDLSWVALAVRFARPSERSEANLINTEAPDDGPIHLGRARRDILGANESGSVIVTEVGRDLSAFEKLIRTLRGQTVASAIDVVVAADPSNIGRTAIEQVLNQSFPGRNVLVEAEADISPAERINLATRQANGKFLLFVHSGVVLHDPRTLETLSVIAGNDKVASAGCVMIRSAAPGSDKIAFHSGGTFAVDDGSANLSFSEPDVTAVFPLATYPVIANSSSLFMVQTRIWNLLGGFPAQDKSAPEAIFGYLTNASAAGYVHVCTSAVTVAVTAPAATKIPAHGSSLTGLTVALTSAPILRPLRI